MFNSRPYTMPLKIKLPLDVKKQHACPNCTYQTKNETALENHVKECQGDVPNELLPANGSLENHPATNEEPKKKSKAEKKKLKKVKKSAKKSKDKLKKKNIMNGSTGKVDAQSVGAEGSEIGEEDVKANGDELNDHKVVVRHYTCKLCGFMSTSSKTFLYHERDEHEKDIDIYLCDLCDYASKWKCKVVRHREMIHRGIPPPNDFEKINSPHRVQGKPGAKLEKLPKTPLSMVPTPEVVPLPRNMDLSGSMDSPDALLNLGSKKSGKKKSLKKKLTTEVTELPEENKKRVTDGRTEGKSSYLQFMELCSAEGAEPRYKCKLCFYSNLRKWQIRQHYKARHENAKLFQCTMDKCTFSTYKKAEFFAHKTNHNQMTYRCEECEYVTFLKPNLDRHKLNHGMANVPYKCSLCSYASAKEAAVMRHIQEHHTTSNMMDKQVVNVGSECQENSRKIKDRPIRPFESHLPGKRQSTIDRYFSHSQGLADAPDSLNAQNCSNNGFAEHDQYTGSYENGHSDPDGNDAEEDLCDAIGDTAFMCPMCGFAANSVEKLNIHMLTHGYDAEGREVESNGNNSSEKVSQKRGSKEMEECKEKIEDRVSEKDYQSWENGESLKKYSSMSSLHATDDEKSVDDNTQIQNTLLEQNALVSKNGDVVCNICGYVAVTMTRLKGHMVSHSNDYKYTCELCPRKYKRSSDLNFHMKKAHNIRLRDYLQGSKEQDEPLNLSMRSNTSNESSSINTDGPEPMDFIEDDVLSDDAGPNDQPLDLSRHEEKEEELMGADMQCPECPYVAKWPSDMRRHSMVHTRDRRYKCTICPRTYKWQGDLNVHLKKFHKQKNIVIPEVVVAPYSTPPKARKGVAGEYKCRHCDYIAKYTSELMRHNRIHTQEKPYRCRFCHYDTAWKGDLKRHIEKHHPEKLADQKSIYSILMEIEREVNDMYTTDSNPPDSDVNSIMSEDPEPLAASTPQKLDQAQSGQFVQQTIHEAMPLETKQTVSEDPCLCKICGWRAPMPSKLHMHLIAHDNIRVYKCTICGFRTNWVWDTRKHVRAKHGMSDPGPYCLKMNEDEARMTIKQYLESREKPTKTVNNNHIIPEKDKLHQEIPDMRHEKFTKGGPANHGYVRPFKCSECPRRSNWKWELKKHIKLVHEGNAHCIILNREEALATLPPGLTVGQKLNITDKVKEVEKPKPTILKTPSPESVSALFRVSSSTREKVQTTPNSTLTDSPPKAVLLSPSVASKGSNQVDHDKFKKFKCSCCPYRSNYRSDVQRHIYNKHRKLGEVVLLEKAEAQATLQQYLDTFPGKKFMGKSKRKLQESLSLFARTSGSNIESKKRQKKWKCNKCEFRHADRNAVLEHLTEHSTGIQAFSCKICNFSSDLLTAIRRHVHTVHQADQENWVMNEEKKELVGPSSIGMQSGTCNINPADLYNFDEEDQPESLPAGEGFVEKRFRCKQCGARSNWKNAMYRHIREVHSLTSYSLIEELTMGPEGLIAIPHIPRGDSQTNHVGVKTSDGAELQESTSELWHPFSSGSVSRKLYEETKLPQENQYEPKPSSDWSQQETFGTYFEESKGDPPASCAEENDPTGAVSGKNKSGVSQMDSAKGSSFNGQRDIVSLKEGVQDKEKQSGQAAGGRQSSGQKGGGDRPSGKKEGDRQGGQRDGEERQGGRRDGGCGEGRQGGDGAGQGGQRRSNGGQRDRDDGRGDKGGEKPNDKEKKNKKSVKKKKVNKAKNEKDGEDKGKGADNGASVRQRTENVGMCTSPKKVLLKSQRRPKDWPKTRGGVFREGKMFGCTLCPYKSVKLHNVHVHQRFHVRRSGQQLKCAHCPYFVMRQTMLKKHVQSHQKMKKLKKASPAVNASIRPKSDDVAGEDSGPVEGDVVRIDEPAPKFEGTASETAAEADVMEETLIASNTILPEGRRSIYECPQCPYLTKSKTDMLYHKQFHRKRPIMKFKCSKCDYWSTHKGLSTQHEKVHDPAWRLKRIESIAASVKSNNGKSSKTPPAFPAVSSVQSSPAKSEVSERSYADYDPVDIAGIKQDLIMSKIMAVPLTTLEEEEKEALARKLDRLEDSLSKAEPPDLLEPIPSGSDTLPSDAEMPILSPDPKLNRPDSDACGPENEEERSQTPLRRIGCQQKEVLIRKLHRCRYCPYTNIRGTNLRLHEQMHGAREGDNCHKCPKCDYCVGNRGLLSHHLKVHTLNYQPDIVEPEVVNVTNGKFIRKPKKYEVSEA